MVVEKICDSGSNLTSKIASIFFRCVLLVGLCLAKWFYALAECFATFLIAISPSFFGKFNFLQKLGGVYKGASGSGSVPKQPQSVTVVLAELDVGKFDMKKLAELLWWCKEQGAHYNFVFDPLGHVKGQSKQLKEELEILKGDEELYYVFKEGWGNEPPPQKMEPVFLNCTVEDHTIHLLCKEDSLQPLTLAAQTPYINLESHIENHPPKNSQNGIFHNEENSLFTSKLTSDMLKEQVGKLLGWDAVSEPEIILIVGKVCTLAGCPPWHARFSEIYYLGELIELSREKFDGVMRRYWKTNQRFGV